jgi:hypothetical protein
VKPTRSSFLKWVLRYAGLPYRWGGRDAKNGVDCSGLVALALYESSQGFVDHLKDWWADRYWTELPPVVVPLPGDLAFYGGSGNDVDHVTVLVTPEKTPGLWGGLVFGANGGGPHVVTLERALELGAVVGPKYPAQYRPDFRGWRSLSPHLREDA